MRYKKYFFLLLPLFSCFSLFSQTIDSLQLVTSEKILFDFGKYNLTPRADSILQEIAQKATSLKKYSVRITAHTDAIGSNERNLRLSQNRAEAVKQWLIEKGLAEAWISTQVFGEEQPASNNDTENGRQLNRRATVEVFQTIKFLAFRGQVKDEKSNQPIAANLVIRTKEKKDSIETDTQGYFRTVLPLGTVAGIDVYAKDYFFETQMFKVMPNLEKDLSIPLKKVAIGEKVDVKNLFFVGNKAILLKRSLPELPKLLKFMQLNNTIHIEIAGHINRPNYPPVDKLSWDFKLSERRAKMVHDYLLENNIAADRIRYKGYGNFQMRFPKAKSEKEQAQNRRVEIRVVEKS